MGTQRGQFTATVKIKVDDSHLDKKAREVSQKLGKLTDNLKVPIGIDYNNGDLKVFEKFKDDLQSASFKNFNTEAITSAMDHLKLSVINSTDELEKFKSMYNVVVDYLKTGRNFTATDLVKDTNKDVLGFYDDIINKQESFIRKQSKLVKKISNDEKLAGMQFKEMHQNYLAAKAEGNELKTKEAAENLFVASAYYKKVAKGKYGEGAAKEFTYYNNGEEIIPWKDITDISKKKLVSLSKDEMSQLVSNYSGELKAIRSNAGAELVQARKDLEELKQLRAAAEKEAQSSNRDAVRAEAAEIRKKEAQAQKELNAAKKEEQQIEQSKVVKEDDEAAKIKEKTAAQKELNAAKKEEQTIVQGKQKSVNIVDTNKIAFSNEDLSRVIADERDLIMNITDSARRFNDSAINGWDVPNFFIESLKEYYDELEYKMSAITGKTPNIKMSESFIKDGAYEGKFLATELYNRYGAIPKSLSKYNEEYDLTTELTRAQENLNRAKREEIEIENSKIYLTQKQYEVYEKYKNSGFGGLTREHGYPFTTDDGETSSKDIIDLAWGQYKDYGGLIPSKSHFQWRESGSLVRNDAVNVDLKYFEKQLEKVEQLQKQSSPNTDKLKENIVLLSEYYGLLNKTHQNKEIFKGNDALFNEVNSIIDARNQFPNIDFPFNNTNYIAKLINIKDDSSLQNMDNTKEKVSAQQQLNSLKKEEQQIEQSIANASATSLANAEAEVQVQEQSNQLKKESKSVNDTQDIQSKIDRFKELRKIVESGDQSLLMAHSPYPGIREGFSMDELNERDQVKSSVVKEKIKQYRELVKAGADVQELEKQAREVARYVGSSDYYFGDEIDRHFAKQDIKSGLAPKVKKMIMDAYASHRASGEYVGLRNELESLGYDTSKKAELAGQTVDVKVKKDEASVAQTATEIENTIETQATPEIKPKADEVATSQVAQQIETKVEAEAKPEVKPVASVEKTTAQTGASSKSTFAGLNAHDKSLIHYINQQIKGVYKEQSATDIYKQIGALLKSSADNTLDERQVADLVAMARSYTLKTGQKSPVTTMMKRLADGKNWDDYIPGYGDLKDTYETIIKENAAKKSQQQVAVKPVIDNSEVPAQAQKTEEIVEKTATPEVKVNVDTTSAASSVESNEQLQQRAALLEKIIKLYSTYNALRLLKDSYDVRSIGEIDELLGVNDFDSYISQKRTTKYNSKREGTYVTKRSLQDEISSFLRGQSPLDVISAYVNGYGDIEEAQKLFAKTAKSQGVSETQVDTLFSTIRERIRVLTDISNIISNVENEFGNLLSDSSFKNNGVNYHWQLYNFKDFAKIMGVPSLSSLDDAKKEYADITKTLGQPSEHLSVKNLMGEDFSYLQNIKDQNALIFPQNIKDVYSNYQDIFNILVKIVDLQKQVNKYQNFDKSFTSSGAKTSLKYRTTDGQILNDDGKVKEFSDINWENNPPSTLVYKNFAWAYHKDYGENFENILQNQFKLDVNSHDYKYLLNSLNEIKQVETCINQMLDEFVKLSNITGVSIDKIKQAYYKAGRSDINREERWHSSHKDYDKGMISTDAMSVANISATSGANAILGQLVLSNALGQREIVESVENAAPVIEADVKPVVDNSTVLSQAEQTEAIIEESAKPEVKVDVAKEQLADSVKAVASDPMMLPIDMSMEESVKKVVSDLISVKDAATTAGDSVKAAMDKTEKEAKEASTSVKELNDNLKDATPTDNTKKTATKKSSKTNPLVAKQEFQQAAKNTKGFTLKEDSLAISARGIVTFRGQIEDLEGNLVNATFKFDQFDKAVVDGALNLDYLRQSIQSLISVKDAKSAADEAKDTTSGDKQNQKVYSLSNKEYFKKQAQYEKVNNSIDESKLINDFAVDKADGKIVTLKERIVQLRTEIENTQAALKKGFTDEKEFLEEEKKYNSLIKKLSELANNPLYQKIVAKQGGVLGGGLLGGVSDLTKSDVEGKLKDYLSMHYNEVKDINYNESTKQATAKIIDGNKYRKATISLREYKNELGEAATQVRVLTGAEEKNAKAGSTWIAGLKKKLVSLSQYFTGHMMIMRVINQVRQGFTFVKELDSQLTTINQTMSVTEDQLQKLGNATIDTAEKLGATSENVMKAVAIYANANETVESILEKAQPTIMLANASGADSSTAADQIQGVVQQFEELEGQERRIVNSYEKISAGLAIDFATGINRMAEGVQTAGSVVESAGMKFETFAASVGKISERTRQEGSSIGNAYKTIMARISRSQSADEDVSDEDRSNASKAFSSVGISLYNSAGEYKDINETLDELVGIWDDLTDAQRNYIAEQAAGVRNINVFTQLIETWGEAKELANDALTDTDFIDETQEKYMESMAAHLNSLKASAQDFWNTLLDKEVVNFGIDALNLLITGIGKIVGLATEIGGIFGPGGSFVAGLTALGGLALGAYKGANVAKDIFGIKTKKDAINELTNAVNANTVAKEANNAAEAKGAATGAAEVSSENAETASINTNTNAINTNTSAQTLNNAAEAQGAVTSQQEAAAELAEATATAADTAADTANAGSQTMSNVAEASGAATGILQVIGGKASSFFDKLTTGFSNLATSLGMTTTALAGVLGGIAALGVGILIFNGVTDSTEETKEKVEELKKSYEETMSTLNSHKSTIDSIKDEFKELSEGVDPDTGTNLSLTTDEYERYQEICNQIADIYPNLVKSYDAQGNAILNLKNNVEGLTEAYKEEQLEAAKTALGEYNSNTGEYENLSTYMENFNNASGNRSAGTKAWDIFSKDMFGAAEIGGKVTSGEVTDALEKIQSMTYEEVKEWAENNKNSDVYSWIQSNLGFKLGSTQSMTLGNGQTIEYDIAGTTEEEWIQMQKNIVSTIDEVSTEVDNAAVNLRTGMQQYLKTLELGDQFKDVDDTVFQQVSNMIANTPVETLKSFEGNQKLLKDYIIGWVKTLSDDKYQVNFTDLLSIDEDSTIEEMTDVINKNLPTLAKALGYEDEDEIAELVEQLGLTEVKELVDGFEEDVDDINKSLNKTNKETKDQVKYHDKIKKFIKDEKVNTKDELNILKQCANETESWAEAIEEFAYRRINIETNANELDELEKNLKTVEETISKINDAYSASVSSKGLNKEQIDNIVAAFENLEEYDYDKLFESTAEGIHLNVQELDRLNDLYDDGERKKYADQLVDLQEEYATVCDRINDETDALERNRLISQRNSLADQIDECQELASMYEGLTNAVTKWQEASSGGEEDDIYNSIVDGLEEMDELYQKDKTGTNYFKSFMQMFSYEDLDEYLPNAGIGYQEYYEQRIGEIQKYFTEGTDGVNAFIDKLSELNMAGKNDDGSWWVNADVNELAKALNWSTAAVDAMFKNFSTYEWDIDFREESEDLKALRLEAEEANKALGEGKAINFVEADTKEELEEIRNKLAQWKEELKDDEEAVAAIDKQLGYVDRRLGEIAQEEYIVDIHTSEGIEELKASLKELNKLKETSIDINWANQDPQYYTGKIDELTKIIEGLPKVNGKIDVSAEGYEEAKQIMYALIQAQQEASKDVILDIDTSNLEGETLSAIESLKMVQQYAKELENLEALAKLGFDVDTSGAEKRLTDATNKFIEDHPSIAQTLEINDVDFDSATVAADIKGKLQAIDATVLAKVDPSLVEGYVAEKKTLTFDANMTAVNEALNAIDNDLVESKTITFESPTLNILKNNYDSVKDKSVTITTNYVSTGKGNINGNAHVQGNTRPTLLQRGVAFAKGTWGAIKNASSLVGELGRELVVRGNQWFTVGDNGAEFTDIRKGDIVFNHKQTEEIFKNGYVTSNGGRGTALAEGNAYASGALSALGVSGKYTTSTNKRPGTNYTPTPNASLMNNSDAADEFLETLDWVEIMIDRLERKIQDLDTIANSAYKTFSKRNNALADEFGKVTDEITLQQQAYNTYMSKANSIALSETYKQKVRDGKLQIEDITDENLKEKIDEYREWYEKALDCKYAITDLNEQLGDLAKAKFDNVQAEFDELISKIEDVTDVVEGGLDIVEARGQFASKQYFEMLMSTEKENIAMIEKEYVALHDAYNEAMATGTIEEGSEAWYEMKQQIRDVEKSLQDANLALIEYKNEMWEMDWKAFEYGQSLIEELTKESEFLIDLLSLNEKDLFSEVSGKLTDAGFSVAGLHAVNYDTYMAQAEEYKKKMQEVNEELAKDPTNTILIDKKNEYLELQRESIQNANDEKLAIRDLISDSYDKMLEILQELIDKRKEALQAEKDLYDYEKNVKEQTKQIADYQKQLSALAGDDSEESKSKRQQLQTSLEEAQSNLEETEYDRWLSDQEKLMDDMFDQYEEILNERLDNIDGLLKEIITVTNDKADIIDETISKSATDVGYQITEDMADIWNITDSGIGKVVTEFSDKFTTTLTTTNEYIKKVYDLINKNVKNADKDVTANTKPASGLPTSSGSSNSSSSSSSSNKTNTTTNTSTTTSSKGSFFVYKKDSYPKNQLNINTSIVDENLIVHPII